MAISQSTIAHSDGSVDIAIVVPFIAPALPGSCKASKPIIDQITATVATTGGTLTGGQSVYYHFTAVDSLGVESVPSEPIEVIIPSGTNTNKVTLQAVNSPFDSSTSTFNVYRSKLAPTGDGTPANNPQQASSGNTPPVNCASLTLTDTGSSISGGGGGSGSGNPPPSQLYIKTRVYYQLPSESIWRLGAETNDASQTSLQFHLPHNIQGQQINVQIRNVFRNGYETPAGLAPVASYTIAAAYPSALGIGAAPPAGSSFGVNGAKIIDNSGGTGIDSVVDGLSRFARTAVHSSHAPTSNPLTAHDAGSNVTINIAANTMQVGGTAVSNNSGSITALSYSTLYYVYYDDPTLAGGAVSYQATTTKTTAINGAGRFFVGSILTPKATAQNTNGNGDGGTGSQYGSLIKFLFNTATPTVAGDGSVTSPSLAIDGDQTTKAFMQCSASSATDSAQLVVSGAPGILTGRASTITLKVLSAVIINAGTGTLQGSVSYSLDGGSTFTAIFTSAASRSLTIDAITLPFVLNPGLIQVKAVMKCNVTTGTKTGETDLYEAWIEIQE